MNSGFKSLELSDIVNEEKNIYTKEDVENIMGTAAKIEINLPTKREVAKTLTKIKVSEKVVYDIGKQLDISEKSVKEAIKQHRPNLEEQVKNIDEYELETRKILSKDISNLYKKALFPILDQNYKNKWSYKETGDNSLFNDEEIYLRKKVPFLGIFSRTKKEKLMTLWIGRTYAKIEIHNPKILKICGSELKKLEKRLKKYSDQKIIVDYMNGLEYDKVKEK